MVLQARDPMQHNTQQEVSETSPERIQPISTSSRQAVQQVIGKLLLDNKFRVLFAKDPELAVSNAGITLTPYEFAIVDEVSKKLIAYTELPEVKQLEEQMNQYVDRVFS